MSSAWWLAAPQSPDCHRSHYVAADCRFFTPRLDVLRPFCPASNHRQQRRWPLRCRNRARM